MRQSFCISICFMRHAYTVEAIGRGKSHASCCTNPSLHRQRATQHMLQIHACFFFFNFFFFTALVNYMKQTLPCRSPFLDSVNKAISVCHVCLWIMINQLPFYCEVESAVASTADWLRRMDGAQEAYGKCSRPPPPNNQKSKHNDIEF